MDSTNTKNSTRADQAADAMREDETARKASQLDEAIDDSFPASDPPAVTRPHKSTPANQRPPEDEAEAADDAHIDERLDEGVEESFPASDPPSQTAPGNADVTRNRQPAPPPKPAR
ncbi:hypothetical protein GCM10011505_12910 [Tistrella bauzanensis]|uniref:Uncharacterized protein n=1 Tax=Tistrella bauzanensis TaxID=657419 RepID=A0ABQ1IBM3_9PROT|nr:hypothetical protein [Tistrella bauzanensis]GGB32883.1 hypothetical protein GCM10011505_12910 [Tistrella bauzanensis]